jgi:hypothetical protein
MPISTVSQKGLDAPLTLTSPTLSGTTTATTVTSPAATALTLQSAGTTAVTVNTSQNVGIGTASPSAKLHVTQSGNPIAQFTRSDSGTGLVVASDSDGPYFRPETPSAIRFNNSGNTVENMRIDTSGNVLVNTTSSTGHKMTVQSAAGAGGIDCVGGATNGYYAMRVDMPSTNTYGVLFRNNGNNVGDIRINSSSTTYNTSSDYRLKENIAPMTGALAKVAQLKPCTYTWKVDGSDGQGFIAHELQEIVPDAVTGEKDGEQMQGIDTSFLVATLAAAIQELNAKVATLEAKLASK